MSLVLRATGAAGACDLDEVRRALAVLADPARGVQLQCKPFHAESFATFRGDDLDGASAWVRVHEGALSVYYALNPVPPDLGNSVRVSDVLARRWLLVDVDRVKGEADKDLSATDAEHEAARQMAADVRSFLDDLGWPAPLLVDSGNGFHLLYRVELPNDKASRALVAGVLKKLAEVFDGARGSIGVECCDARRISKLPGTWARKGPNTTERPHRLCCLLHVPAFVEVVDEALLSDLAGAAASRNGHADVTSQTPPPEGNLVLRASGGGGPAAYGRAALDREIGRLLLTLPNDRNNALNRAAFALGSLVAGGALERGLVEDALYLAACRIGLLDDHGCGEAGIRATIASGMNAGAAQPRGVPERNGHVPPGSQQQIQAGQKERPAPEIYRLPDLLGMDLPPPRWAVHGLLAEGLGILAGKPKLGKSWMALNLALTVAAGGLALGSIQVTPGDVLYLSLEDRLRRVQDRSRKLLASMQREPPGRLQVSVRWERAHEGGLDDIRRWAASVERPALVVIDVWARFKQPSTSRGNQYEQDYQAGGAVKELADELGATILIIHHCKKAAAEDVMDEISGTLGFAGSADTSLVLTRSRGENEASLHITGRDVDEQEMALEFNPQTCAWKYLGNAAERTESRLKGQVIELFKANAGNILALSELAAQLQVREDQKHYLRVLLYRMANETLIERVGPGKFRWPVQPAGQEW